MGAGGDIHLSVLSVEHLGQLFANASVCSSDNTNLVWLLKHAVGECHASTRKFTLPRRSGISLSVNLGLGGKYCDSILRIDAIVDDCPELRIAKSLVEGNSIKYNGRENNWAMEFDHTKLTVRQWIYL